MKIRKLSNFTMIAALFTMIFVGIVTPVFALAGPLAQPELTEVQTVPLSWFIILASVSLAAIIFLLVLVFKLSDEKNETIKLMRDMVPLDKIRDLHHDATEAAAGTRTKWDDVATKALGIMIALGENLMPITPKPATAGAANLKAGTLNDFTFSTEDETKADG